jgi:TetR/AcrR family transcriptional repressor of bet genes
MHALLLEMSEVGYERASTKSIAARAGLASGLVHYHFKNKEDILLALVDNLIEEAEQRFIAAINSTTHPADQLSAFIASRVGLGPTADATQVKAWVCILAEAMGQPGVRIRVAHWLSNDYVRISNLFSEAKAECPHEHASLLIAMILGSFSLHAIAVQGIPTGYAQPQIQHWLTTIIGSHRE